MNTGLRCGMVAVVIVLAACGGSPPTAPTQVTTAAPAVPSPPFPSPTFPPLAGPSRTFTFDHELTYPVMDYTKRSQFVLYDNGAFVLRYSANGEYRGSYSEADGLITFAWEGSNLAGPWGATATLKGGLLSVHYNFIMQLSDFEDAAYSMSAVSKG